MDVTEHLNSCILGCERAKHWLSEGAGESEAKERVLKFVEFASKNLDSAWKDIQPDEEEPIDCTGLESDEFDDTVHDEKAAEASAINNGGVEDQVEYLVERLGREETAKLVTIRKAEKRS